jgi:hypothetical protein
MDISYRLSYKNWTLFEKGFQGIRINVMKINCQEHRKDMELLSLRMRLEKGISDPEELREAEERIKALEEELELD